jgi:protein phosphatase inhibitor 2
MDDSADEDDRKPSATGSTTTPPKKVKPALKKKPRSKSGPQHLKWDEAVIEEHDMLRGTRMKIDEPNTPYTHYDSGAESDDSRRPKSPAHQKESISWDNLQNRLDTVAAVQDAFPKDPSVTGGDTDTDHSDVEPEHRKEMRDLEFREHRKRHYNEMELVKKFRQEHPDGAYSGGDKNGDADDEAGDADDEA